MTKDKEQPKDEATTEHLIVVRVMHTAKDDAKRWTPVMVIRRAIHDASATYDISESDVTFHQDRPFDYFGRPVLNDFLAAQEIVERTFAEVRAFTNRLPKQEPSKERAKKAHQARALRALAVVKDYEERYNESL